MQEMHKSHGRDGGMERGGAPQSRPLPQQVGFTQSMLLINVAALMEHHSRRLLQFSETKQQKNLDENVAAANYIKTREGLVLRIQATICEAERRGACG